VAWFKIDDGFTNSKPVLRLQRRVRSSAIGLWTLAGAWSAKEMTDGFIPDYVLEELASTPAIAGHLVKCGLWEEAPEGWKFKGWEKYQPTREQIMEARERETERKRKYRESQRRPSGTSEGQTEGHQWESGHPDPTRPDPTPKEEPKGSSVEIREDVKALCELLADRIEANGSLRPTIGKTWTDSARRMLDLDGRETDKAANLIRWSQANPFWRKNILSMPTFREKYDQLRLAALEDWDKNKNVTVSPDGEINVEAILGRDVWSPGTPPEGLDVAGEIAWKKEQRALHQAERLAEAKRKMGEAA
jgi:hypothetical protein